MATTLWLVRHGETSSNAEGVFQGHLDVVLNQRGEEQAAAVGSRLAEVQFAAVYASDLQRAARTAEIIVAGRHEVVLDRDLREMHYGVLQGTRYHDAPALLDEHGLGESWTSGEFHRKGTAAPGGESIRQFRGRSRRFVQRIDATHSPDAGHHILVVAHGGKLSVLMTVLLGLPAFNRHAFRFANCGITRVSRAGLRTTVDLHNLVVWDDTLLVSDRAQSGRLLDPGESHLPRT
ncbi:MAG: histidine phosphatase family protein [Chloroflexota bacterium]|nr:histidine phosphatase family protein [Chloroflexota bacterium]